MDVYTLSSFMLKVAHCIIEDVKSRPNVVKQNRYRNWWRFFHDWGLEPASSKLLSERLGHWRSTISEAKTATSSKQY